jgi:tetratricopeptide (TPR) repeat protein
LENIEILGLHAKKYALGPYHAVSLGFRGEHSIKYGDAAVGVELLKEAVEMLRPRPYQNFFDVFATSLANCLASMGAFAEALIMIDEAIAEDEKRGGSFYTPEILRTKGNILASIWQASDAEAYLKNSLEMACRQAASIWGLRAATSLAKFYLQHGKSRAAFDILEPACGRVPIDIDNRDIAEANEVLRELNRSI